MMQTERKPKRAALALVTPATAAAVDGDALAKVHDAITQAWHVAPARSCCLDLADMARQIASYMLDALPMLDPEDIQGLMSLLMGARSVPDATGEVRNHIDAALQRCRQLLAGTHRGNA